MRFCIILGRGHVCGMIWGGWGSVQGGLDGERGKGGNDFRVQDLGMNTPYLNQTLKAQIQLQELCTQQNAEIPPQRTYTHAQKEYSQQQGLIIPIKILNTGKNQPPVSC